MKLARRDVLVGLGLVAVTTGGGSFLACRGESTEPPDRGQILVDTTNNVFVPAYNDLVVDATALETAMSALRDGPSATTLEGARAAWKKARRGWKFAEAFLFGPANDLNVTGGTIDTSGDRAKLEAIIEGQGAVDEAAAKKLGASQRGFGAIEALLFDPTKDGASALAAFGAAGSRRGVFGVSLATDLKTKLVTIRDQWTNTYAKELTTAGRGSATFSKESQGVDIVVNALVQSSEIIITLALAKPLGIDKTDAKPAPELVESPFSDNSIDDILAELDGIEAVYFGTKGGATGLPLSEAVRDRSPSADASMRDVLPKAKAAVSAIQGPLRTAVLERRDGVLAAHVACREVKRALATQVAGALGTSLGFSVTDGD